MSKYITRGMAMATGLMAPVLAFAQSDYYNDYYYDDYYYNDYDYAYDSGASTALGFGMIALFGVMALVGLVFFIFQVWMIIDCIKRQFEQRTMWLVILIAGLFFGFGWIASIIYFFMVKHKNVGAVKPAGGSAPPAVK